MRRRRPASCLYPSVFALYLLMAKRRSCAVSRKGARDMIHVIAIITAKPGKRDEVLGDFRANMPAVHAEAGCIEYGPATDAEGGPGAKYGPTHSS